MWAEKRGFFSIDALFAVTFLLTITASFLNLYEGRKVSAELTGARLEAKIVGEKLAAAINTVYANGPKFKLYLYLPENIGRYYYKISFDNITRQISVENSAWGTVTAGTVCNNVPNFVLTRENLKKSLLVYWVANQVRVVNP